MTIPDPQDLSHLLIGDAFPPFLPLGSFALPPRGHLLVLPWQQLLSLHAGPWGLQRRNHCGACRQIAAARAAV